MKKRKIKNSIKVLLVIVIIIFLANFISSNSYLIYRGIYKILNNNTINENIITTEDTKDILKEMAKSDSRINKILENYDEYQYSLKEVDTEFFDLEKFDDPDVRYYARVVDKNRAGAKPKLLFRLNLAYNMWEELGYLSLKQ